MTAEAGGERDQDCSKTAIRISTPQPSTGHILILPYPHTLILGPYKPPVSMQLSANILEVA